MSNVVRFTLPSRTEIFVPGVGLVQNGVFDVLQSDTSTVTVVRARLAVFSPTETVVDTSVIVIPPVSLPDPYPQYATDSDLTAFVPLLKAWDGNPVAANSSFLDWGHDSPDGGYLIHLHTNAGSAAGSLLALGIGDGGATTTNGLLVSVKSAASTGAAGIGLVNQPGTDAWGLHGQQNSADAPLIFLEQTGTDVAPALTLTANGTPGAGQLLQQWRSGAAGGDIGGVRADTGDFEWQRNLTTMDRVGGTRQYVGVQSGPDIGANGRDHGRLYKESIDFYKYTGSPGQWWSTRIDANSNTLRLRAGGATGTLGTPSGLNTLIEIKSDGIGFFGTAAAVKPTGVAVTAAGIHAALVTLGLIAA